MRRALVLVLIGCGDVPCPLDGECRETRVVTLEAAAEALAAADLDGDGHVDLVSAGVSGVAIRPGPLENQRPYPRVWSLPAATRGLATGDFDGDGRVDVVTAGVSAASEEHAPREVP